MKKASWVLMVALGIGLVGCNSNVPTAPKPTGAAVDESQLPKAEKGKPGGESKAGATKTTTTQ